MVFLITSKPASVIKLVSAVEKCKGIFMEFLIYILIEFRQNIIGLYDAATPSTIIHYLYCYQFVLDTKL